MTGNGSADANAVKLMYRGNGSAQIRGPVTGRVYQFPRHNPVQPVDARDVAALIRTRLFAQVK
ncbi:MAG TPA: hypothetical protein VGG85_01060 [Terracidiphilus sp.]|jgi:hypothetical protein